MLNHDNNKNNNIPQKYFKNLARIYISLTSRDKMEK